MSLKLSPINVPNVPAPVRGRWGGGSKPPHPTNLSPAGVFVPGTDCPQNVIHVERKEPKTTPRKKGIKTTQLSLAEMRRRGYELVEVVEHRIPHTFITRDLWGIADIVCVGGPADEIVAVQVTSDNGGNVAKRRTKIVDSDAIQVLRRVGIRFLLHGWKKRKGGPVLRELDLS